MGCAAEGCVAEDPEVPDDPPDPAAPEVRENPEEV
jgi:hypothetical protein